MPYQPKFLPHSYIKASGVFVFVLVWVVVCLCGRTQPCELLQLLLTLYSIPSNPQKRTSSHSAPRPALAAPSLMRLALPSSPWLLIGPSRLLHGYIRSWYIWAELRLFAAALVRTVQRETTSDSQENPDRQRTPQHAPRGSSCSSAGPAGADTDSSKRSTGITNLLHTLLSKAALKTNERLERKERMRAGQRRIRNSTTNLKEKILCSSLLKTQKA